MKNRDCISLIAVAAFVVAVCKLAVLIGGANG